MIYIAKGARVHTMAELLELFPNNPTILDAVIKTEDHIFREACQGGKIMVSISGGSDSDIMMDMIERLGYNEGEVVYVWFDTGLEYEATKKHLVFLEEKYDIAIKRVRPQKTVAQAVKQHGVPFLSKFCSDYMGRLQHNGFLWESEDFAVLHRRHPNAKAALRWWTNNWGEGSSFNISKNAGLKEFIQIHPPDFTVSSRCCDHAKKYPAEKFEKEERDLRLCFSGVRKAEGGKRATTYASCFSSGGVGQADRFRPIFYFSDRDKEEYKRFCGVTYSDCYEIWGLTRTGCVCCPFGSNFEQELEIVKQYEPKLYAAANKIFGPSYEYTRQYRRFKEPFKREKRRHGQIDLFNDPSDIIKTKGEPT